MSAHTSLLVAATLAATAVAGAQPASLAARVTAAPGAATLRFATRDGACGDGREFIALGERITINGSYRSIGGRWTSTACVPGPARVTLVVRGGAVDDVRVRVGGAAPDADARDLGAVPAAEAAAYLLTVAGGTSGRVAQQALVGAALADSADVWRPLLALARRHADADVARSAMHWLGAVAPAEAVPVLARARAGADERRPVREGAAVALAHAPGGMGVPALVAAASGRPDAGGADAWVRDRAVFWLGNARDPRARATLRTLAAADTAPETVRAQAIFALGHLDRDADGDAGDGAVGNAAFLRTLYPRLTAERLQDRLIQSIAQMDDAESRRWLLGLAADAGQPLAARKRALFWAGQQERVRIEELVAVDPRLTGAELRRHYAFVLSQRREDAAVDQLIAMARAEPDRGVRRQAIFWLGQSRSPRARRYLESVVAP
jgi:HEAT repeat protein